MKKHLPWQPTKEQKRNANRARFGRIKFECFKLGLNFNNGNHFLTAKAIVDAQMGKLCV